MDFDALFKAALLGLVEGLTEFIPVSSTGHLIIAADWLSFGGPGSSDEKTANAFLVFIQLGAILAVVWLFRKKFWDVAKGLRSDPSARRLVLNLIVGTLPAVVVGLPTEDWIERHLFKPLPVAAALVAGGIAILVVERLCTRPSVDFVEQISLRKALGVGCFQVLAILFPGLSRSGATILGGLTLGLSRRAATEFSFFLAIPAMCGASVVKLAGARNDLAIDDAPLFAVGFLASFVSALVVIRWLLVYVSRHSFAPFAWYRIIFGAILLAIYWNASGF
ncbi:MAG: undecaprenyl-diphosphate phosphatase [Planctomycetaceae bacterium]